MVKSIGASLVLVLSLPSIAMAQRPSAPADRVVSLRLRPAVFAPIARQGSFTGKSLWPAPVRLSRMTSGPQPPDERSWAARHPTVLGTLIGAGAGAVVGAIPCWPTKPPCGDSQGPLLLAFGAGLGAGIGATVGFTISLAGR